MEQGIIPVYKVTVPITKTELTLSVRGDWHYGLAGVEKSELIKVLKREQDQHRGNQFVIYTGDLIENNLNNSVGHGYDIAIRDPHQQKLDMRDALVEVQRHLHGNSGFKRLNLNRYPHRALAVGVVGNHEYRSRTTSGQWIQEEMYGPAKILDMGMNAILELTLVNKKLKMEKTYSLYVAHRPNKSNATAVEVIIRNCKKKRGDIPADLYVYGHFHRRLIHPDGRYTEDGQFKKVLYVVNPSPLTNVEYADWSGFSPLAAGWYVNVYLPLDKDKYPYGKV